MIKSYVVSNEFADLFFGIERLKMLRRHLFFDVSANDDSSFAFFIQFMQVVSGHVLNHHCAHSITQNVDCCADSVPAKGKIEKLNEKSSFLGGDSESISYRNQSTARINETSLAGNPTVSKTMTRVTKPAWGMPAAPIEAAVAVMLK